MIKMKIGTIRRAIPAMILALLLSLAGCGVEVTDDEGGDNSPPPQWQTGGVNFAETAITKLDMIISPEFSSPTLVDIYARVHDQGSIFVTVPRLNQYNFTIAQGARNNYVDMNDVPYPDLIQNLESRMYALALDSSGSMGEDMDPPTPLDAAKSAAKNFVRAAVGMGSTTCAIVDFDNDARLVQKLTSDIAALDLAIDSLEAQGATAIGNALIKAATQIGARPGRGAIILLTDGANTSGATPEFALDAIKKFDLPVYAIGFGVSGIEGAPFYSEEIVDQLNKVATETGGLAFYTADVDLVTAFAQILAQVPPMHDAYRLHSPLLMYLPGQPVYVNVGVSYQNVNGLHQAMSSGTIEIP